MIYPWYVAIFDASIARDYLDRLWQTAMAGDSLPLPGDESWRHCYTPHIQHDTQQIGSGRFFSYWIILDLLDQQFLGSMRFHVKESIKCIYGYLWHIYGTSIAACKFQPFHRKRGRGRRESIRI